MNQNPSVKKILKYTSVLFILVSFMFCGQKTVVQVNGVMRGIDGTIVRITDIEDRKIVYDSAVVKDGKFSFSTDLPDPGFYKIDFESSRSAAHASMWQHSCMAYFENDGKYTFESHGWKNLLDNDYRILPSSPTQQDITLFQNEKDLKMRSLRERRSLFVGQSDVYLEDGNDRLYRSALDSISYFDEEIRNFDKNVAFEFITRRPASGLTPYLICQMNDFFERYLLYNDIINKLPDNFKKSKYAKKAMTRLKKAQFLHVGGKVPQICGMDIQGMPFSYDFTAKKYVLIAFWASWSVPSRMQIPRLKQLYGKYHERGFDIINISLDERDDWWRRISRIDSIPWYNVCEVTPVKKSKNMKAFAAKYLPYNYLVNGKKEIVMREIDLDSLDHVLNSL